MLATARETEAAVVPPQLLTFAAHETVWYGGGVFSATRAIGTHLRENKPIDPTQTRMPVTFVCGCCFLIRADVVRELGGFDESFFTYVEDTELSVRLARAGPARLVALQREPRSAHPSLTPSQLYRTQDGWLFVMCNKEKFWPLLTKAIGKPEWATHPDYANYKARLTNREQLTRELDAVLGTATTVQWLERLSGIVPVAPVYDVAQALDSPFVREQGCIMEASHPARGMIRPLAAPLHCPGETAKIGIAPTLGQHTRELLRGLGYDEDRINHLAESGAL